MNKFLQRFETFLIKKHSLKEAIPILIVFISIFICITVLQNFQFTSNINGILSQFQVLTSILLTIYLPDLGFYTALILNIFLSLIVFLHVFYSHSLTNLPGVFIPLFTILTISILRFFVNSLITTIRHLSFQNSELQQLNTDLDYAHKDLKQQNEVLESYHQIIRENENRLSRLAYYDLLTNLPNRTFLSDRMELLISFSQEYSTQFYIVFIDLNQFHRINDMIGISGGDFCLQVLAERLQTAVDPDDLLARLGSDKFTLIIKRNIPCQEVKSYLTQLSNVIIKPINFEDQVINIHPDFGVALYPHDGNSVAQILTLANSDVYKRSSNPDSNVTFFSPAD